MDAGIFFGGVGIEVGTYAFQPVQDLIGASLFRAFENQVLNEVCKSGFRFAFIPRSAVDEYTSMGNRRCVGYME